MTPCEMKTILSEAGVRVSDAAEMFHVSRGTVYRWLEGLTVPRQESTFATAIMICERIKRATARGELPIKHAKGECRKAVMASAIKKAGPSNVSM